MSMSTQFPNHTLASTTETAALITTSTTLPDVKKSSVNTILVVSLCVSYFWCASFSAYEFIAKRALLSKTVKVLQLCLGIQSFLRCVFLALAYFVKPGLTIGAEFELAVLGDLPGILYAFIFGWLLCNFIANRFDMRTSRGQGQNLALQLALIVLAIIFLIAWSVTVALVSTQTSPGDELEPAQVLRLTTFIVIYVMVVFAAVICTCLLKAVEETKIVQKYRMRKKPMVLTAVTVAVCCLLRTSVLTALISDEVAQNQAHRWVLLLDNQEMSYLALVFSYYFCGEVVCSFLCCFYLRNRLFGNEHELLLERGFLATDLELRANDIVMYSNPMSRGGFGAVYKARLKGCLVAVKKFLEPRPSAPDLSSNAEEGERRRRFVQEAEFLARLRHPRIVQYLGYVYLDGSDNSFSIVTEFVAGGSLFGLLHTKKTNAASLWTLEDALRVAKQVCEGIAFLHSNSIIHRDIKSANILLDRHRRAIKICDFGLSKLFDAYRIASNLAATSTPGTPYWAAPELLRMEAALPMSDIYSFGITMFEMLSRRIPFKNMERNQVVRRVRRGELKPDLPEYTPAPVKDLVMQCWHRRPEERPTADTLIVELTELLRDMERSVEGCKQLDLDIRGPNQQFHGPARPSHSRNASHMSRRWSRPLRGGSVLSIDSRRGSRRGSRPQSRRIVRNYKATSASINAPHKPPRHKSSSSVNLSGRRPKSKRGGAMHEVAENISLLDGSPV